MFDIINTDEKYFMQVFGKRIGTFTHGRNCTLYDETGKSYTDFLAGIAVNCLGYSDEGFKTTLKSQVDSLIHTSNYFYNEPQAMLSQALCEKTDFHKVFFGNSGAEANECAIKLAKKYAFDKGINSNEFITLRNSFHGRTLTTLFATGQSKFHTSYKPFSYDFKYIDANDINQLDTISKNTCGVIIELIQGEGGVLPLTKEYVLSLRKLCTALDVPLIIDEVQSGIGRTGKFLSANHYGIKGDITTLAKALGNGIPIGACLVNEKLSKVFGAGDHGSTFGGNLLACSAALYVTNAINDDMLLRISQLGEYLKEQLNAINLPKIKEVRGMGLFLGVQLDENINAHEVFKKMFEKGFVIGTAGNNTLRFVPPYVISREEIHNMTLALKEVLN